MATLKQIAVEFFQLEGTKNERVFEFQKEVEKKYYEMMEYNNNNNITHKDFYALERIWELSSTMCSNLKDGKYAHCQV